MDDDVGGHGRTDSYPDCGVAVRFPAYLSRLALTNGSSPGSGHWVNETLPAGTQALDAVSCPTTSSCWAVGGGTIVSSTNGGISWSSQTPPSGVTSLDAIPCPDTSHCWATAENENEIVATANGGATWTTELIPQGVEQMDGISCPTSSDCWAVGWKSGGTTGGAIIATTDGGTGWVIQSEPQYQLSAVSCPTSRSCVAIGLGDSSYATSDGGSHWTAGGGTPDPEWVAAVACPSASDCWAAGFNGDVNGVGLVVATTNQASTWTAEPVPDGPSI